MGKDDWVKRVKLLLVGSGASTTYGPSNAKFALKYFNVSWNQ